MDIFYSAMCIVCSLSMIIMAVLIHENARLTKKVKHNFYLTYIVFAVALFTEWTCIALNGAPMWTYQLHAVLKAIDYIATPLTGYFFAMLTRESKPNKILPIILCINVILQISSIFTGWTFYLDDANYYHHGVLYPVYALIYISVIITVLISFWGYGKQFSNRNRFSLLSIIIFIIITIAIQEIFSIHIWFLGMVIGSYLLYIHYTEFSQIRSDDEIDMQKQLLNKDVLTGLLSRYAYTEQLKEYAGGAEVPNNFVAVSMDINELKYTNDHLGHLAGDELIQGASSIMKKAICPYGKCFRTGGDEFIAMLNITSADLFLLTKQMNEECASWHGQLVDHLNIALGYASKEEYPGLSVERLIQLADKKMYEKKDEYYTETGKDRRAH